MITASSTSITNFVPLFKRRTELQSTCDYQHCPSTQTETILHLRDFSSQSKSRSVVSNSLQPHGILPAKILKWVASPFPGDLPNPGLTHCTWIPYQLSHKGSPRILVWVAFLQQIFLTQESNRGLLHCRRIIYRLSHQVSPYIRDQFSSVQSLSHVRLFATP